MAHIRTRRSFRELEKEHFESQHHGRGPQSELEILIRAFKKIQDATPSSFNSFFTIAGYHGEPFRGAGWGSGNAGWWGGYCHHGNILFPTWHRAYLWRLESALRESGVEGAQNIALPFWDECDEMTRASGIPDTFGLKEFVLSDGSQIKNPLHSYKFPVTVWDNVSSDQPDSDYTKHKGYETVRYPQSGLGGDAAKAHNQHWSDPSQNWEVLNQNVKTWLGNSIWIGDQLKWTGIREKFHACLEAPNYTVFSNTSSAAQHNETKFDVDGWKPEAAGDPKASKAVVPLESPHNSIHLAVGGFDIPGQGNDSAIAGANGDMGENDTASFDPIFYFHHCFVDYAFWKWQQKHNQTEKLVIEPEYLHYPGTNSTDSQGATPGVAGNSWLSIETTALEPFTNPINRPDGDVLTSQDVANIENLGYTYGRGSLDVPVLKGSADKFAVSAPTPVLRVTGASRAASRGSFLMTVWADLNGDGQKDRLVGLEPVLSRQHVEGCANCQTHLGVKAFINLHAMTDIEHINDRVEVRVHTREDPSGYADDNVQWKRTTGKAGAISK